MRRADPVRPATKESSMRSLSWLTLLTALCAQSAVAQTVWHLDAEVGKATYTWAVRDTSANPVTIRPWHPTIWSIRLSRDARRFGVALSIGVALGQEGGTVSDVTILPGTDLNLAELAPEVRYLVHRTAAGAALR